MKAKSEREVAQSCPTLSDPMDCSLSGSSIHGIFQARVLEWGCHVNHILYLFVSHVLFSYLLYILCKVGTEINIYTSKNKKEREKFCSECAVL